jgi:GNAT superfamily N-acetyltransferase
MPVMLAGWSTEELLHAAVVAPRGAFVALPDTRVITRPGWFQLITPSLRRGGLNEVGLAVLAPDAVDAVIDATIAEYAGLGLFFRWAVPPDSAPADLAERLAARGLDRGESVVMAGLTERASTPRAGVTVELVGAETVDDFNRVMATGWGMDPAPLAVLSHKLIAEPERGHFLFMARHQGEPAGTATYANLGRSAYLMGAVVLPRYRGLGLYRALTEARLSHAAVRGLSLATCQARAETSAPILAHLGFVTVCRFPVFTSKTLSGSPG